MKIDKPGIIPDMSNHVYHRDVRDPEDRYILSSSTLKKLADSSPAKAFQTFTEPEPEWNFNRLSVLQIGTLFHTLVLEPKKFGEQYEVIEDGKKTKLPLESGKLPVRQRDFDTISRMQQAVMNHPEAARLVSNGYAEHSVFSKDWRGFWKKCRPDYLKPTDTGFTCIDLKSTSDASMEGFSKSIGNFKYHWSAAFYLDVLTEANPGIKFNDFRFIAVEKKLPEQNPEIGVAVYRLHSADIESARQQYQQYLDLYGKCLTADEWPGYSEKTEYITLPSWATWIEGNTKTQKGIIYYD